MMSNELFGKPCVIKGQLVRDRAYGYREWVRVSIPETKGILIGKRTLQDGWVEDLSDEDGYSDFRFNPQAYMEAYLVVENMHKNPYYVLLSDIEVME